MKLRLREVGSGVRRYPGNGCAMALQGRPMIEKEMLGVCQMTSCLMIQLLTFWTKLQQAVRRRSLPLGVMLGAALTCGQQDFWS